MILELRIFGSLEDAFVTMDFWDFSILENTVAICLLISSKFILWFVETRT